MAGTRYVVMGAGEVGYHLARTLSQQKHDVSVIEIDPQKRERIEDELDVLAVEGNGAHPSVLEAAGVSECNLFMAVSSADEANLAAAHVAKHLGAARTVVRVGIAEEAITHRRLYEEVFGVDLLLSTQLLSTTRVLNRIRGHNTVGVEYLAEGKVQLRKIQLDDDSLLTQKPLAEVEMPANSLVVAYFRGDDLIIPAGADRARTGDEALILGTTEVIGQAERMASTSPEVIGTVVIAGAGGATGRAVASALSRLDHVQVKLIERDRRRAHNLAARFPQYRVIQGDINDVSLLRAERVGQARCFVALSGNDESNLMASLLARELGVPQELALVHRTETTELWRHLGLREVFSPRQLAYQRVREYIDSGYSANIVSLKRGAAQVLERRLAAASPVAGVTLAEMKPPRGLIVGAVARDDRVFVPRGNDRLQVGDLVILFVKVDELDTVRLLFPGRDV
ncbi:MAG: Trk system potassium transporter TrkA [Thermoanaerobaculia bacterium]